jgi:hypothetical protein
MTQPFPPFKGNCPKNVSKDAKYSVRTVEGEPVATLTYLTADGEQWLATTHPESHRDLVDMVNAVKTTMGSAPNGPFYINEYGQVIVPVADGTYYLAGEYDAPLEFKFEGKILSGRAVGLDGRLLEPGDLWTGPHPGIPHVLTAGGGDIYYRSHPRPLVTRKVELGASAGAEAARAMADRIQGVKGWQGGRFYINEWREIFGPVDGGEGLEYRYVGHLDEGDPWFPKPS